MRRALATMLGCALAASSVEAQFSFKNGGTALDTIATRFKIDFAIPEAPALSMLQVTKNSILRPGTVREFAVLASDLVSDDGGMTVPEELGFEASPAMLIGGHGLSLTEYNRRPWLYRLRLSGAVKRKGSAFTGLAFGVRVAIHDEADLRSNPEYLQDATEIATAVNKIFGEQNRERPAAPGTEITVDDLSPARKARLEELAKQLKARVEERAWNADIIDLAAGALASSRDSTGAELAVTQVSGWFTYGKGFGDWGQLLFGARGSAQRDTLTREFAAAGSVGTRLYAGVNRYKVFLEAERKWAKGEDETLLGGGGELRLISGGWIQFSSGLSWQGDGKPKLVGNATFKLGVLGL